jgi:cytochrome c-type biogenesis protein CcmH/NrfG
MGNERRKEAHAPSEPASSGSLAYPGALFVVLAIAAGVRLWHVLSLRSLPLFDHLIIDSQTYDVWARRIANGDWVGDRAFFMDPLYPYALAVLYRFAGHDLLAVRLVQIGLGVGTCWLVAVAGRRVGGRATGILAALFVALYQPLVFEEGEVEKTALGVFLVAGALASATARTVPSRVAAGVCLALASLTRGNLRLLFPFGVAYFLLDPTPIPHGLSLMRRWKARLIGVPGKQALAFLLGLAIVLAPILVRNRYVSGEWILTTSHGGVNFYTGNNPSNWSGAYTPVPFVRPLPIHEEEDFHAKAEQLSGRRLTASEVSTFWFGQALDHIARQPGFAAKVFVRKVALFWSDLEVPDGWSMYFIRQYSPGLKLSFFTMGWLLPLAAVGSVACFRNRREVRLLVGYVIVYSVSVVAFFVFSRYRIFVVPAVAILAALGATWLAHQARGRDWRSMALPVLAGLAAAAIALLGERVAGLAPEKYVHNYAHLAEIYQDEGNFKAAEALLMEALRRQPGTASALSALGTLRLRIGDTAGSVAVLEDATRADPRYPNVWYLLGTAYEKANDLERAKQSYWRQLDLTPDHREAMRRLRYLLAKTSAPPPAPSTRP